VRGKICLEASQEEIQWLLDRGYKLGTVIEFIGIHYQLTARQRSALQRALELTGEPFSKITDDCIKDAWIISFNRSV